MRILLALILGLFLAGPVEAILVEGTITASILSDFGPQMNLRGEEFSLRSLGINSELPLADFVGPVRVDRPVDVSNTSSIRTHGNVTYQGETFVSTFPNLGLITGSLTFDVEPFLFQEAPPFPTGRRTFDGESPFTMTGQLSFDGHTVALEGSGIMTVHALESVPGTPLVDFDLVRGVSYGLTPIPEPGTLLLFGTAAGLGALYGLRQRRRGR
jgi:hypothetical protein